MAGLSLMRLKELVSPAAECAIAIPLPAVAQRQGTTLATPKLGYVEAIFNALGSCVAVSEYANFERLLCITSLMGDFYKRQLTAQQWLVSHGVPKEPAAAFVGATFAAMAADSAKPGPETLEALIAEQTPGGLNEMVWKDQEADGNYNAMSFSLDSVHRRIVEGVIDPELKPAAKRPRLES
mmetsp:Transcript_63673/g.138697  ORF Transcript_63673/g.138697 Transcript_63673/m.138697 type:complete len:181 (-) Transcript_63673:34-576(-)